jgi:hypothetical protein
MLDDINVSLVSIPEEPTLISASKKLNFEAEIGPISQNEEESTPRLSCAFNVQKTAAY